MPWTQSCRKGLGGRQSLDEAIISGRADEREPLHVCHRSLPYSARMLQALPTTVTATMHDHHHQQQRIPM